MKGIVFNLLEQAVVREHGEEVWDKLLDSANTTGAYTAVGSYPHQELDALVAAASAMLGQPPDDVQRWFGRAALPLLVDRYPVFFDGHTSTRAFLLTLNDVIHPEVRKLFPGAYAPSFEFDETSEEALGLTYESHRELCAFAEGLVEGAAVHFGERVAIDQTECTKRGDARCTLRVTFTR
jgi:hypothetical protein